MQQLLSNKNIIILGLGYVGLPLYIELLKQKNKFKSVTGFDINQDRINELNSGFDRTNEVKDSSLLLAGTFTSDPSVLGVENAVIVVTVPTPVTSANVPDLSPIEKASKTIASHMTKGSIIIYESTVYPGVTEEICVPLLEGNGLKYLQDFNVGYSPERINPGDKVNTITSVVKIVSGDTPSTLELVNQLYSCVTKTHKASTIKVAEAAKVIENTQRDINIALMNELSAIFSKLNIDTHEVIEAASTKWNFLKFVPGLVGGHCISVDPYYLTHRAQEKGYVPSLILAAREINDQMPFLMCQKLMQNYLKQNFAHKKISIMGATFKENVPDIRNSKVFNMVQIFKEWGFEPELFDPLADPVEVEHEYGVSLSEKIDENCNVFVFAVSHLDIVDNVVTILNSVKSDKVLVLDIKNMITPLMLSKINKEIILVTP